MIYEEAYKFTSDVIDSFFQSESRICESYSIQLYSDESQAYALFAFLYPNLFIKEQRDKLIDILNNPVREQLLKRIRIEQMFIMSLTGKGFVDALVNNLIDAVLYNAPNSSRALRRELVRYFNEHPFIWFCALASKVYTKRVNERLRARAATNQTPETQRSARTIF